MIKHTNLVSPSPLLNSPRYYHNNEAIPTLPSTAPSDQRNIIQFNGKKAKLSLCMTKNHAMKTYEGVEVEVRAFLTLTLHEGERSASRPGRFAPW